LGNLAAALVLEPQLPTLLKEVIIMGGAIAEPGNVSPVAEANIWNDPHAADKVFCAGWRLTMVGLDVTHQVILPVALFKKIAAHQHHIATDTLLHAVSFYANFYSNLYPHVAKIHGCFGHDVLAFIYLTNPELFALETGRIRVATDGLAQGQTMMRRKHIDYPQNGWGNDVPDTHVCMKVDSEACSAILEKTLMGPWLTA
jgi:inosine-uridine nucleoside N-ribohydrolase